MFLQDDPKLQVERINYTAMVDIAPEGGDGVVNYLDLQKFFSCWMTDVSMQGFDPVCDLAPSPIHDGKIDFLDYSVITQYWLETVTP